MELGAEAWGPRFRDDLQDVYSPMTARLRLLLLPCLVPLSEVAFAFYLWWFAEFTGFLLQPPSCQKRQPSCFHGVDGIFTPKTGYICPIGYNSRASTLVVSGTEVKTPHGPNQGTRRQPTYLERLREVGFSSWN